MLILLAIFLVLAPGHSAAQGNGISARLTTPSRIETTPGQIVSAAISVSNSAGRDLELYEQIPLPSRWSLLPPASGFSLKSGERQLRIIAIRIPADQPAGDYDVVYGAKSPGLSAEARMTVHVKPVVRIELLKEESPESVIAGERYRASVRLLNKGNVPVAVMMKVENMPKYPLKIDRPVRFIAANGSEAFSIEVATPGDLRVKVDHVMTIEALALAEGSEVTKVKAEQTVIVPIIPKVSGDPDPYHRLVSHVGLVTIGGGGKVDFQAEFGGSGSIDEAGRQWIDFLFRGPDARDQSLFGQWDEYRVSYGNEHMEFHVGDKGYHLSALSEMGRYGRGVEGKVHAGRFETGAYFFATRWEEPMIKEAAAYFQWRFNDLISARANLLEKVRGEDTWTVGRKDGIATIEVKANYGDKAAIVTEYATGRPMEGGSERSDAYRVNLGGKLSNRLRYSYERLHAEPRFAGYYSNMDSTIGQLFFPISSGLTGNFSYRSLEDMNDPSAPERLKMLNIQRNADIINLSQINGNPLSSTLFGRYSVGISERSYKGGISYAFPWQTVVSLDYEDFNRKTLVNSPDSDFSERAWTLGIGHLFPQLTIQTYAENWTLDDRISDRRMHGLGRYSVYAHYYPDDRQSYSAYMQIGNDRYSGSDNSTKSFGFSGSWSLWQQLRINLNYQRSVLSNHEERRLDSLYSSISWTLPNSHTINARLQWIRYQELRHEDPAFLVAYTIPFGIPLSRKTSVGVVRGRVYEKEATSQPPLANVTLSAGGLYAVTDENGEYSFPSLKPGTYYLWPEKKSLGFSKVTMEKVPIKVEITGGVTTVVDIAVVQAASISGAVAESEGKGIGEILIEATCGERTVTQLTDDHGRFSFEELPPCRWIVKVSGENLPALHILEKDAFVIDLKPGENREITVKAVPRKREILIIDSGKVESQGGSKFR